MSGEIAIRYGAESGPDGQQLFRYKHEFILGTKFNLADSDLRRIPDFPVLRRIDISENRIASIDLSSLSDCKNLEYLSLSGNMITEIDLAPLETCAGLRLLDLSYNQLSEINLRPLRKLPNLSVIFLHFNRIKEIDVTPLLGCRSLALLDIEGWEHWPKIYLGLLPGASSSQETRVLLDILAQHSYPQWLATHERHIISNTKPSEMLIRKYGWKQVREWLLEIYDILPQDNDYAFQKAFFHSLNLEELACYDGDFIDIINLIPDTEKYELGRKQFYFRLIQLLAKQLERGGSTLFFDIDRLSDTDAAMLVPSLLEERKREVKNLRLTKFEDSIDLTPLWLTGYGHDVLKAMNAGRMVSSTQFNTIKKAFAEIGIKISTTAPPGLQELRLSEKFQRHVLKACGQK
ncbi:MAG: leucine-rich repeat domain-containing protein [Candidatus Thorarchaeota archaeon]